MKNSYIKPFLICLLTLCVSFIHKANAQQADLRFKTRLDCAQGLFIVTPQISTTSPQSFSIGNSTLLITYNPSSVSYTAYQSLNFNPANGCATWDEHAVSNISSAGILQIVLSLRSVSSCPQITNLAWIDLGDITFKINNPTINPQISFNTLQTTFNSAVDNNGNTIIPLGTLTNISVPSLVSSATLTANPSTCNPATNTYTLSGTATVNSLSQPGTLTFTTGALSQTIAVGTGFSTVQYSFANIPSAGGIQSVVLTGPACASATALYTAPAACSVATAPPCQVALAVSAGSCNTATNQYTLSGTLNLTNITQTTSVTITNGTQSVTGNIPANSTTFSFSMAGLPSDGANRTVTATFAGTACNQTTALYTAPAACSVAPAPPCVVNVSATPSACSPATNSYTLTGSVQVTNGSSNGVLTISSGGQSITVALASGITTYSYSIGGLPSNGTTGQVTASISGTACGPVTQTFTAPVACSCAQAVITTASATPATCAGIAANSDAAIQFTAIGGTSYLISGPGITQSTPMPLTNGSVRVGNLPNPATTASYTILVYTATSGPNCPAIQQTVTLQRVSCDCPPTKCIPIVAERLK